MRCIYKFVTKGLTTRQLAERVGIVPATVLMYERENFPIPYQTAVSMTKVLEINKELLFDDFARFIDYPYTKRVQAVRKNHGLSLSNFAEKAGKNFYIYSRWELGNRSPPKKCISR